MGYLTVEMMVDTKVVGMVLCLVDKMDAWTVLKSATRSVAKWVDQMVV
jgi:hypothetical protein